MSKAFSINSLEKSYKDFKLGPLDLDLEPGVVMGMIGPNGSGKTTTINCMAGLIKPERGSIDIFGNRVDRFTTDWKYDIGYIGDEPVFYEKWSGWKNLCLFKRYFPDWSEERAVNLADRLDLSLGKRASDLSKGDRAKLYLITVLARKPKLLVLDEPASGLDPLVRAEFLDLLWELQEAGESSIIYSTHILSDIDRIADELVFLKAGRIIRKSTKENLIERWRKISFQLDEDFTGSDSIISHEHEGATHVIVTENEEAVMLQLKKSGAGHIRVSAMSMSDIAIRILKGGKNVAVS